jgi:hypothetical protein
MLQFLADLQLADWHALKFCGFAICRLDKIEDFRVAEWHTQEIYHSLVHFLFDQCVQYIPGGYKEMSSVFADQQRPRLQMWGDWGEGGGVLRGLSQ